MAEAVANYISTLTESLNNNGLAGLIGCRTGMYILELYGFAVRVHPRTGDSPLVNAMQERDRLKRLSVELLRFFGIGNSANIEIADESAFAFLYQRMYENGAAPTHIRLQKGGSFIEISDLLAQNVCESKELPFSWLATIPISSALLRPLIDRCRPCLARLLITLSERQFEANNHGRPLLVQNMQRILKLARASKNSKLLEGTLVALSSSKFLNLAGPELTLKLIRSTESKSSVARNLFFIGRKNPKEISILTYCAKKIVENPNGFSLGTRIAAANYLAEHIPVVQPPLLTVETDLGLQIQQRAELN